MACPPSRERRPLGIFAAVLVRALVLVLSFTAASALVTQRNQEHGLRAHRGHLDIATEGDSDPRLQVETIEQVENVDVVALRWLLTTVGLQQRNPLTGHLGVVEDGEVVSRKCRRLHCCEIEPWRHAGVIHRADLGSSLSEITRIHGFFDAAPNDTQ